MANHHSAKVRIRRNARRTKINGDRLARIRTYVKRVETAIASGDKSAAEAAYRDVQPELHRGVNKRLLHANTVARRLSRLSARIKALS